MAVNPGRHDFKIRKGDTFRKTLTFSGSGFPADITGFTARMDIVDSSGTILISLTTDNGRISIDGPNLKVTLLLTDDVTAAITWTTAFYDLELKDSAGAGDVTTYLEGEFCVEDERTLTET